MHVVVEVRPDTALVERPVRQWQRKRHWLDGSVPAPAAPPLALDHAYRVEWTAVAPAAPQRGPWRIEGVGGPRGRALADAMEAGGWAADSADPVLWLGALDGADPATQTAALADVAQGAKAPILVLTEGGGPDAANPSATLVEAFVRARALGDGPNAADPRLLRRAERRREPARRPQGPASRRWRCAAGAFLPPASHRSATLPTLGRFGPTAAMW